MTSQNVDLIPLLIEWKHTLDKTTASSPNNPPPLGLHLSTGLFTVILNVGPEPGISMDDMRWWALKSKQWVPKWIPFDARNWDSKSQRLLRNLDPLLEWLVSTRHCISVLRELVVNLSFHKKWLGQSLAGILLQSISWYRIPSPSWPWEDRNTCQLCCTKCIEFR